MPYVLIRHKVQDYAAWKSAFDEHSGTRQAAGSKGGYLMRSADDPNELVIIFEWDDLDKARQFTSSDDLRQTMERAGVIGPPDIHFLEQIEQPSA
jgi:heme-degrading monooxygenase HmoA